MKQCQLCNLPDSHPFGIFFTKGICSGCLSFESRREQLLAWNTLNIEEFKYHLTTSMGELPKQAVVPFDADGETWYVIDLLLKIGIRPIVVYFNAQYHDFQFFSMLSACQEKFDVDFYGFSLPKQIIQGAIAEEISSGIGHCRNLEIYGRHAASLYTADQLKIRHIISGPHQQSEIVGSHSYIVRNQLKSPAFQNIVMGHYLLPQVQEMISLSGSSFSQCFKKGYVEAQLEKTHWHYLSDYIFWDSEAINSTYGMEAGIQPRIVNGYGNSWQSSSSSLKLEFYDLLRYISTGTSKIDSYLSRDIRFKRLSKNTAIEKRNRYLTKTWELESIAHFFEVPTSNVEKMLDLYLKKMNSNYTPNFSAKAKDSTMTSHNQNIC